MKTVSLPASARDALEQHRERCAQKARAIQSTFGSLAAYRDTLKLEMIDSPEGPRLDEFYDLYRSVFTLEDECEPVAGFATVMGFNQDSRVQREFGPFLEPIIVMRDPSDGRLVGAANFIIYAYPGHRDAFGGFDASCQLNFLLVRADLRGLGIATDLLRHTQASVERFALQHCGVSRSFTTIEMNDPSRMTADQIEDDALAALIDPAARSAWWHKQGFRRLDLPYVQPPLSPDGEPCTYLNYHIRLPGTPDASLAEIPSAVLHEHLRRFFTVSVGKFEIDMGQNREWRSVSEFLQSRTTVRLIIGEGI